ncbi:MAG: NAD-dependent epimerase/dehydratase family protein [Gemmataceae bacterium]
MHAVHLDGTRNVLTTACPPGTRLVHTSSVVAVGARRHRHGRSTRRAFNLQRIALPYVHAKRGAEELVVAAMGAKDVVVVNPGYLVGPDDHENSVMGRLCVRALEGAGAANARQVG